MKVLGIITEYNPFHNGHMHHLKESLEVTSADAVVCVMSGNFVQRGEPAVVDKWLRAEMALRAGVDLVIELPAVYALSSAELFAFGAVKILDSLGFVDCMCFGSETGDLDELDTIAGVLAHEPEGYREMLKKKLGLGLSFPDAREKALLEFMNFGFGSAAANISELISSSNNILGIEYLKALKRLESKIRPYAIPRLGASYNSRYITGPLSSATSIRNALSREGLESDEAKRAMPSFSYEILKKEFPKGRGPVTANKFERILVSRIRSCSPEEISAVPDVSEGLENRIRHAAMKTCSFDGLVDRICTRRYTATRITRILFNLLLGVSSSDTEKFNRYGGPRYIRVLGFNKCGREMLTTAKTTSMLPVIVKAANFKNSCNPLFSRMLGIDTNATDQYVLGYENDELTYGGQDYTRKILISSTAKDRS